MNNKDANPMPKKTLTAILNQAAKSVTAYLLDNGVRMYKGDEVWTRFSWDEEHDRLLAIGKKAQELLTHCTDIASKEIGNEFAENGIDISLNKLTALTNEAVMQGAEASQYVQVPNGPNLY